MSAGRAYVRVRPLNAHSREASEPTALRALSSTQIAVRTGAIAHAGGGTFEADGVLVNAEQADVWRDIGEPLVDGALIGRSGCVMAVGPSGGGKGFTLGGTEEAPGLAPRLLHALCSRTAERPGYRIELSMLEVYQDRAYDLLVPRAAGGERRPLEVTDGAGQHPPLWFSKDASSDGAPADDCWHAVRSFEQAESLRRLGDAQRTTRPTALAPRSARAHTLLFVRLTRMGREAGEEKWQCRVCLASLGGIERVEAGGSLSALRCAAQMCCGCALAIAMCRVPSTQFDARCHRCVCACARAPTRRSMREALNLGASLSAVGGALHLTSHGHGQRVQWQGALLQLLRDSLEGHTALAALAALSPAESLAGEALATLRLTSAVRGLLLAPRERQPSAVRQAALFATRRAAQALDGGSPADVAEDAAA
eukprot:6445497-Prymnesium_polylepis.1